MSKSRAGIKGKWKKRIREIGEESASRVERKAGRTERFVDIHKTKGVAKREGAEERMRRM
jgi:hypothetical protein